MLKYNNFPNILMTLCLKKTRIFFIFYKYLCKATQEKHHHHIHLFILLLFNIYIELYTSLISSCSVQTPAGRLDAVVRAGWGSRGVSSVCTHTRIISKNGYSGDARANFKNCQCES